MAATSFLSANALTQKHWSETAFKWQYANHIFSKFMGEPGSGKPFVVDKDYTAKKGDTVTYKLLKKLSGAGGSDDTNMEGAEESATVLNMPISTHERSHAVVMDGLMSDKRTTFNILKDGFVLLNEWATEEALEKDMIYAITGLGNRGGYVGEGATPIATVNEKAPSANRIIYGGQTTAGVTSWKASDSEIGNHGGTSPTDHLFGTQVIHKLKTMARMASPKFPPVRWMGKSYYILIAHPFQIDSLREETASTGWPAIQAAANVRGRKNPLFEREGEGDERMFDGLIGIWDDVLLYDSELMPTRVAGGVFSGSGASYVIDAAITSGTYRVARAVLLGRNAGVLLWGQHWQRRTKQFDYDRKTGVGMDAIYGFSKSQFRDPGLNQSANDAQEDYAVYCADTVVKEP